MRPQSASWTRSAIAPVTIQCCHRVPASPSGATMFGVSVAEFSSPDRHETGKEDGRSGQCDHDDGPVSINALIRNDRLGDREVRPKSAGGGSQRGGSSGRRFDPAFASNHRAKIQSFARLHGDANGRAACRDVSAELGIETHEWNRGDLGDVISLRPERLGGTFWFAPQPRRWSGRRALGSRQGPPAHEAVEGGDSPDHQEWHRHPR